MKMSTTDTLPGSKITSVIGIVSGSIVQSKHIGRDFMAGLKTLIGGEIAGYTEMINEARDQAIKRMKDDAKRKGADAIVSVRFTTSAVAPSVSEILVYGTGVHLTKLD